MRSVPLRMAMMAASRIRWDSETMYPPVRP